MNGYCSALNVLSYYITLGTKLSVLFVLMALRFRDFYPSFVDLGNRQVHWYSN